MATAKKSSGKSSSDRIGNGALFHNDKGDNEARPDFTGRLTLNAENLPSPNEEGEIELRLACWVRESQKGTEYLSVVVSEPRK